MFAENYPTVKHNRKILDYLPGKMYILNAIDQIPGDCKYPEALISLAENKKQSETGGLSIIKLWLLLILIFKICS